MASRPPSAVSSLLAEGSALLSALPDKDSADVVKALLASETPLAVALRNRIIRATENGGLDGEPGPLSPISELVREADVLLSTLPAAVADSIALAVQEGDNALAVELRRRAIQDASAVSHEREQMLGSPGLSFLLREGERLIRNLTADASASVVSAVLEGESQVASHLRRRMFGAEASAGLASRPQSAARPTDAPGNPPTQHASQQSSLQTDGTPAVRHPQRAEEENQMPHLVAEARQMLRKLPDRLALDVVRAVAEEDSPLAAALRQAIRHEDERSGARDLAALIESSEELIASLPEEAAILLVTAVLEGESALAAALRLQLQERPRSAASSVRSAGAGSRRSSAASDQSRPLTGFEQLMREGKALLANLPDHLAGSVLDSAWTGDSALSAAIRTKHEVMEIAAHTREDERRKRVWSLKHNRCTRLGLQPTLGVVEDGQPDVKGVLLDLFGRIPKEEETERLHVVQLDEEQATQLTLRMEASGKTFKVLPFTWERLDDCEEIPELKQVTFVGADEQLVPVSTAQGEVHAGAWEYFEFEVDESWNAVEVVCEANAGFLLVQKGVRPDDGSYDPESEANLLRLRDEWQEEEALVARCHKAGDDQAALLHLRNATALFKQIEVATTTRKKCYRHIFPPHGGLFHMTVVSNPSAKPKERPAQTVQRPFLLSGEIFPGKWHVALKCTSDPRHPMRFRLSLRSTTKTHLQEERAIRVTHLETRNQAEEERRQVEEARAKIHRSDLKTLEKLKWEKWNKVELARALGAKFAGTFYPPKLDIASVTMQRIVRGYLARRRKRWLGQVKERRRALKKKEEAVKASLSLEDKLLIKDFKSKFIPQELDDIRSANSAAVSLRFGQLKTAYQLRTASRAVFNVVDELGAGVIETEGIHKALMMLGLDDIDQETLEYVLKAFDDDGSGSMDRDEFNKMVLALCSSQGPDGIKAAVAAAADSSGKDPTKIKLKKPKTPPPAPVPSEAKKKPQLNTAAMTASQLDNVLQRLKMRLTNRSEEDDKKQAAEEEQRRAEEAEREEAESLRRAAEERHAAEVERRAQLEREEAIAAAEAEAASLRIVGMSLKEMLKRRTYRTEKEIEALAPDVFSSINLGGDGLISYQELKEAVRDTDLEVQDAHLRMAMDLFDHERATGLTLPSFTKMLKALLPSPTPGEDVVGVEGTKRLWRKLQVFTRAVPSIADLQKRANTPDEMAVRRPTSGADMSEDDDGEWSDDNDHDDDDDEAY